MGYRGQWFIQGYCPARDFCPAWRTLRRECSGAPRRDSPRPPLLDHRCIRNGRNALGPAPQCVRRLLSDRLASVHLFLTWTHNAGTYRVRRYYEFRANPVNTATSRGALVTTPVVKRRVRRTVCLWIWRSPSFFRCLCRGKRRNGDMVLFYMRQKKTDTQLHRHK